MGWNGLSVSVGFFLECAAWHLFCIFLLQGPKEQTIPHFWKMVWDNSVRVICMVTALQEHGRPKCHQYWPHNTKQSVIYDDFKSDNFGLPPCNTIIWFPFPASLPITIISKIIWYNIWGKVFVLYFIQSYFLLSSSFFLVLLFYS